MFKVVSKNANRKCPSTVKWGTTNLDGLLLPASSSASPYLTIRPGMSLNDSAKEDEYNSRFVLVVFLIH